MRYAVLAESPGCPVLACASRNPPEDVVYFGIDLWGEPGAKARSISSSA